ncbi:homoserine O-acetyltransferase [Streptomyces sp. NPDC006393]|uniref:homoserine O-acetyltransferase MetX n=1 Tax=Streptomyces sp. NPDC006393 TaxID=3156763 RepID=UPI0033C6CA2B
MTAVSRHVERAVLFGADRPLRLRSGRTLTDVHVAYERFGPPDPSGERTVFVCHALTGDSHVTRHHSDDRPGWWEAMVGPHRPIDTRRFHVVCANVLGGCAGTTGPAPDPRWPARAPFPQIEVADMVTVHRELLRRLGVPLRLYAVVGGSLGGMQALEWLLRHPRDAGRFGLIATSARLSADNLAQNAVARAAILADPRFRGGRYPACDPPVTGLGIARMVGHLTYMSQESLEAKFGRDLSPGREGRSAPYTLPGPYAVERYLEHQAHKLTKRFDANSYLCLTAAMDRFDPFAEPHDDIAAADPDVCVLSFRSDRLFGLDHSRFIAERLLKAGVRCAHVHEESSRHGHDAFLKDVPAYLDAMARWLGTRARPAVPSSPHP